MPWGATNSPFAQKKQKSPGDSSTDSQAVLGLQAGRRETLGINAECLADGKRSVTTPQDKRSKQNVGSPTPTHPQRSPDISINIFVHNPTHSHNHLLLQLHL